VAPLLGGWLTRAWRPGRSGAPNVTGKMAKWRGDHRGARIEQQKAGRAAVAAHDDGVAPPGSGDGGGSTWGSSGSMKITGSFTAASSSSSQLQLR
jgi:hypothetical protein